MSFTGLKEYFSLLGKHQNATLDRHLYDYFAISFIPNKQQDAFPQKGQIYIFRWENWERVNQHANRITFQDTEGYRRKK
jgi:hypothetical protein